MVVIEAFMAVLFTVCMIVVMIAAWGEWATTHLRTLATLALTGLIVLFTLSVFFSGVGFTGGNLHPYPPPIPAETAT